MHCSYFSGKYCFAVVTSNIGPTMPTDDDKKEFCETKDFETCPRFRAKMAIKGK
jgi:hypothetical protein